jgi:hypothetical protein
LPRTFHKDTKEHADMYIPPLRNVLYTFLKRNPTIGYTQGHNYVVGCLLKYLNEEESFWIFTNIIENMLPGDYYSEMLGIHIDQRIFNILVQKKYPKLVAHMQKFDF